MHGARESRPHEWSSLEVRDGRGLAPQESEGGEGGGGQVPIFAQWEEAGIWHFLPQVPSEGTKNALSPEALRMLPARGNFHLLISITSIWNPAYSFPKILFSPPSFLLPQSGLLLVSLLPFPSLSVNPPEVAASQDTEHPWVPPRLTKCQQLSPP